MKQPSGKLFELIKSLSQTEKRYLRVFANMQAEDNNYMRLFDAIEKQNVYDEQKIREKFKNENFLKQLTVAKTYLYNLILKSLRNYHSEKSVEAFLKNRLQESHILFEKGLLKQAEQMLEKVIKKAEEYEKFFVLNDALILQDKIFAANAYEGTSEQEVISLYKRIKTNGELMENYHQYRMMAARIFWKRSQTGNIRSEADVTPYKKLISAPLFKDEKNARSISAKLSFHLCWFIYYFMQNKFKLAAPYVQKATAIMEANPKYIQEDEKVYISLLVNKGACDFFSKNYVGASDVVIKLKKLYPNSKPKEKKQIFFWANNAELSICIRRLEIEKAIRLIDEINAVIEADNLKPLNNTDEIYIWSSASYIYFIAGNYKKANEYLNKIINSTEAKVRADIYTIALILQLIVHYESDKTDLVEYAAKSVYRYLYKKNRLYELEKLILNFIRTTMAKIDNENQASKAFEKLKNDIKKTHKDPLEKNLLGAFDLLSWLESKVQKNHFITS